MAGFQFDALKLAPNLLDWDVSPLGAERAPAAGNAYNFQPASSGQRNQLQGLNGIRSRPPTESFAQLPASPAATPQSPPMARNIFELRQQQAEFGELANEIDRENRWMAYLALVPAATLLAAEAPFAVGARLAVPALRRAVFDFPKLETWQRPKPVEPPALKPRLNEDPKWALRKEGRKRLARANGVSPDELLADVHHSSPLEFADVFSKADPNRLANLWALRPEAHTIATREWNAFRQWLAGRPPTQAEVMAQKLRIDRLVAPYIRRPGVARSYVAPNTRPTGLR